MKNLNNITSIQKFDTSLPGSAMMKNVRQLSFEFVQKYDTNKINVAFDRDPFWNVVGQNNPLVLFHFKSSAAYVQDFVDAKFEGAIIEITVLRDFIALLNLISNFNQAKNIKVESCDYGSLTGSTSIEIDYNSFINRYPALKNSINDYSRPRLFLQKYASGPLTQLSMCGKWALCVPVEIIGDVIPYPS